MFIIEGKYAILLNDKIWENIGYNELDTVEDRFVQEWKIPQEKSNLFNSWMLTFTGRKIWMPEFKLYFTD